MYMEPNSSAGKVFYIWPNMYSAVYKTSAKTTSLMLTHFLRCAAPLKLGTSAVLVKIAIILMKSEAMIGDGDDGGG